VSDTITYSSTTVNCPDVTALAQFYADITGGTVTYSHPSWATMISAGGRIDFQTVETFTPPRWPEQSGTIHLDFLVDDLVAAATRVAGAGATRHAFQPNAAHCLVFTDPVGHPFCLTTLDEIG
jgi:predicted enzyme related to lactoylglutathione lyase